jgi:hypothetical protein
MNLFRLDMNLNLYRVHIWIHYWCKSFQKMSNDNGMSFERIHICSYLKPVSNKVKFSCSRIFPVKLNWFLWNSCTIPTKFLRSIQALRFCATHIVKFFSPCLVCNSKHEEKNIYVYILKYIGYYIIVNISTLWKKLHKYLVSRVSIFFLYIWWNFGSFTQECT